MGDWCRCDEEEETGVVEAGKRRRKRFFEGAPLDLTAEKCKSREACFLED